MLQMKALEATRITWHIFCHHFLLHYLPVIGLTSSSSSLREFPQIKISSSTIFFCILLLLKSFCPLTCSLYMVKEFSPIHFSLGPITFTFLSLCPCYWLICHFSVNTQQECRNVYIVHLVSPNLLKSAAKTFLSMWNKLTKQRHLFIHTELCTGLANGIIGVEGDG